MGWSYGKIIREGKEIEIGYGVEDVCNKEGCETKIDRGLSYLCNSCGYYFCDKHLGYAYCDKHDEAIHFDGAIMDGKQCCEKCEKETLEQIKKGEIECLHD